MTSFSPLGNAVEELSRPSHLTDLVDLSGAQLGTAISGVGTQVATSEAQIHIAM